VRTAPFRRLLRIAAVLLLSLAGPARGASIAIEDVTVVDAVNGARPDHRVIVSGDRIVSVAPMSEAAPPVDRVVDGGGGFLIPGLWDMHVHFLYDERLTDAMAGLFLRHGITSVRDTGGDLDELVALRERLRAGSAPAPRVYLSGPLLDGANPVYDGGDPGRPPLGTAVPDPQAAERKVAELAAAGADFIKIYELVVPDVFDALVAAARARDLPIAAHVPLMLVADQAGPQVDSMEHLRNVELACAANWQELHEERVARITGFEGRGYDLRSGLHADQRVPAIRAYDAERCAEVLASLRDTIQVPTLRLNTVAVERPFERPRWGAALRLLPQAVRADWGERTARMSAADGVDPAFSDWSFFLVGRMHEAGVPVGAGTDTPIGVGIPGESLHTELEWLVRAGLEPRDALYAATVQPARFLGLERVMGQVRPGMRADLVLLDRDPLEDITATREIRRVMSRGAFVPLAAER
jgi:imidazolonepropionase-like amidohydrolase